MKYSNNTGLFNRKCLSHFFVTDFLFFFILIFWLSVSNTFSQTSVKISLPLDRTVFQQSRANNATFQLTGQIKYYAPSSTGYTLEYQIESLSKTGEVIATTQSWTGTGINYSSSSGFFNKTLSLSTGWYRISVRYNTNFTGGMKTDAIKVGVGEVIFAAGQSNAQGVELKKHGGIPNLGVNYDCINTVNENCWCKRDYVFPYFKQMEYSIDDGVSRVAPNGNQSLWCYQALGKQIVDKNTNVVTPVAFFNAGSGGTGIDNWSTSSTNSNAVTRNPLQGVDNCALDGTNGNFPQWHSEGPQGHPYRGLKTGLNYYGGMLGTRGVIWHQGESDTKENTSEVSYRDKLRAVIQQTRNDFNSNLGWAISRVSRLQYNENIITSDAVKRGQAYINSSASSLSNITWGGYYSDEITDRLPDNTHFNASGLLKLAELYATGNFAGNTAGGNQGGAILSLSPVEFNNRPSLAVNVTRPNTGEITMTVSGSHNGYKWVKNEGKMSEAIYFTQGITVNNDGTDKWRCYVSDNKGNVAIAQEVALPVREAIVVGTECPSGTFRPSSDKITCDEISGWVFRDNANGAYGVVDVYVDGYKKNTITANLSKYYYDGGGPRGFASNEGYIYNVPANASWRDGVNHTVSVRQCNYNVDFASASLNCPANSGGPSCDNGASPFSMTSVNYNSSSRCVEYQFNANNLSNANWSIKQGNTILYSGSLPQPITSNTGTVNCGVTLASGTYNFVLTGVSCNGTTTRAFTVSGSSCSSPTPGLSANPTSISSGQSSTLSASGCSGTITWNDGTTGSSKTVSSPGTYTATCTNSGCSASNPASVTVGSSGNPSCDNGASPFSMTSVNYNSSSRCVEYQFNANNLSNANWSIKQGNTTLYSGSLPQPITSNIGTVNCGVTLASGIYNFVLTGVSCNGTTTRAFTVSGGGCSSPTPGLSANPTSISSGQSSTLSASGCSGTITWNDGTTGSSKTVSSPGTYTATCTNSGCSASSPASVTVGSSSGGGCPAYTEGQQFLHDNSTNENFYAHFSPNGVLYATIDGLGLFPPVSRQRLINAGLSANTANCFADGNTGSRLASVESVEIEDVFKAAPNPSSGRMTLLFTLKNNEVVWFNLYDVYGKSIQIVSFDGKKGQNQMEVDLSNYPSLIYYIHLQSTQKNETIKVLKKAE